jgi:hypothetical protein|uniref:Uncharacterized protein n=1 Tax=viral metagenome TaxID=1070528 RepID=A0A6C0IKL3_9ZZZZ
MEYFKLIIVTFIVTALWDVVLRFLSLNNEKMNYNFPDFVRYLKPYFKQHTMLSAALIAGFVGAITQPIILYIMKFPSEKSNIIYIFQFMILSYVISAFFGILMKATKLFPHLDKHYYDNLGTWRGMYLDGISGLIVQSTILIILLISDKMK